jgi:hypothetical protein
VYVVIESTDGTAGFGAGYVLDSKGTGGTSATGSIKFKASSFGTAQRPVPRKANVVSVIGKDFPSDSIISPWLKYMDFSYGKSTPSRFPARAATSSSFSAPVNVYTTYGGNVYMGSLTVSFKRDSKGDYTVTTMKP